jgi:phosphoglycerate dehydrogenase-like enzyme
MAGTGQDGVRVIGPADLRSALADADMVCLTCSLNESTRGLFDRAMLSHLRRTAWLINLSRGAVVVEADLVDILEGDRIGGAALDCFETEPLAPSSPLWALPNVLITPHTGGETDQMERRFVDLLLENLSRLAAGGDLVNEVRP